MAAELTDEQIKQAFNDAGLCTDDYECANWLKAGRAILALATQQATQGAEPVAWMDPNERKATDAFVFAGEYHPDRYNVAVYTAPPPTAEVEKLRAALTEARAVLSMEDAYPDLLAMVAAALKGDGHDQ